MRQAIDVDLVAARLARWGRSARAMPRGAFEVDARAYPLLTTRGERIGRMVPGHGLALDADLSVLGITKKIPHVIERSRFMRALERLADDRGALTSIADIQAAYTNWGERVPFSVTLTPVGASSWIEQYDAGIAFGSAVAPTRTTAGAYNAQMTDPPAGKNKYLVGISTMSFGTSPSGYHAGMIVDALSAVLASGTILTSQTITMSALTRYTSGVGVYGSVWAALGSGGFTPATPSTLTIKYTSQAGTANQTATIVCTGNSSTAVVSDNQADVDQPFFKLASGDFGLRTISNLQLSVVSAASPGGLGLLLYAPIVFLHSVEETSVCVEREARSQPELLLNLPVDGSGVLGYYTLLWYGTPNTSNTGQVVFTFDTLVS